MARIAKRAVLNRLLRRDFKGSCSSVFTFVLQDKLRAQYIKAIAEHMSLQNVSAYRQCHRSLQRIERDVDVLRLETERDTLCGEDSYADWWRGADGRRHSIVSRHRVTTRALWTANDLLGLQLPTSGVHLEKGLKRSLDVAQWLLGRYAKAIPQIGTRLFGNEAALPLSAVVSFDHHCGPRVDFSTQEENNPREGLCVFVELPYWYAVKHRHLPTLAHELAYAWLHAAGRSPDWSPRLRGAVEPVAAPAAQLLLSALPAMSAHECRVAAHAYAAKLLADLIAYSIVGPSYLFSFYCLHAARLHEDAGPAFLPLETRLLVLLAMHDLDLGTAQGEWRDVFLCMTQALREMHAERKGSALRLGPDARQLAAALLPIADWVARNVGFAWRQGLPARGGDKAGERAAEERAKTNATIAPRATWNELAIVFERARVKDYARWKEFFEESHWSGLAIPTFLWGQYLDHAEQETTDHARMGSLAQPLWDAVLRPDTEERGTARGEYVELRFFRLAPKANEAALRHELAKAAAAKGSDDGLLLLAGVIGAWDLLTISGGASPTRGRNFPPAVEDAAYVTESHLVAAINVGDKRPTEAWWEGLTSRKHTYVLTQFLLAQSCSIAHFLHSLNARMPAAGDRGIEAAVVLSSLGWDDVAVLWKVARNTSWSGVSELVVGMYYDLNREPLARSSRTQVLCAPALVGAEHPPDATEQLSTFAASLELNFGGVQDSTAFPGRLNEHLGGGAEEVKRITWSHIDSSGTWPVFEGTNLSQLRSGMSAIIREGAAVCVTANWMPGRDASNGNVSSI